MSNAQSSRPCITQLFNHHHRSLVRFLFRMTRCPQRAEDLAQVAWLKVLDAQSRAACDCADEAQMRAFLFTVARNAFLDEYTRKHASTRTSATDPAILDTMIDHAVHESGPESAAQQDQVRKVLSSAVERLPAEQRKVLALWCGGSSIRDMAAKCQAPTDTVLSRKKYAIARLRGLLDRQALAGC
ncbi:MAG: RNA polymerase sigma factor [Steroidobacteraceae bacterium]